jgi:hypothetical protein
MSTKMWHDFLHSFTMWDDASRNANLDKNQPVISYRAENDLHPRVKRKTPLETTSINTGSRNKTTKKASSDGTVIQAQVQSMLTIDRCTTNKGRDKGRVLLQKYCDEIQNQAKRRKIAQTKLFQVPATAKSSVASCTLASTLHPPTFNKQQYESQKKQAALQKVTRKLQKINQKAKSKKSTLSNIA